MWGPRGSFSYFPSATKANWIYGPKDVGRFLGIRRHLIKEVPLLSLLVCVCGVCVFYTTYGFMLPAPSFFF